MKKKVIYQIIMMTMLLNGVNDVRAQDTTIGLELVKDAKVIPINDNSSFHLTMPNDTLIFAIKNSHFTLPDSLRKNGQRYDLNLNGYKISYDGFPLIWNTLKPKWIITIDTYPFAEEHLYLLKNTKKDLKWISILDNGNGTIFTGMNYNKLKRVKQLLLNGVYSILKLAQL